MKCSAGAKNCIARTLTTSEGFCEIRRRWSGTCDLLLTFSMECRLKKRSGNTTSILRGPLVYALKIAEEKIDELINNAVISEYAIGDFPFSSEGAPIRIVMKEWIAKNGSTSISPVNSRNSSYPTDILFLV